MMSKKNFQEFADVFARHKDVYVNNPDFVADFVDTLKSDNPRFDRERFHAWILKKSKVKEVI